MPGSSALVLGAGVHLIGATYSGDRNYPAGYAGMCGGVEQQVIKADTSITVAQSPTTVTASIAMSLAQENFARLQATAGAEDVQDGNPSGSVQFFSGKTLVGTAPLIAGAAPGIIATATLNNPGVPLGPITAVYAGDSNYNGSGTAPVPLTSVQFVQQGSKLVGTGALEPAAQGAAVALSADGGTAIVGGPNDGVYGYGAAWVFTQTNGAWIQQEKLFTTGPPGEGIGSAVALSADGNTSAVGATSGNPYYGNVRMFTRANGAWTQQGYRLFAADIGGLGGEQGASVALAADGNTLLVGGPGDHPSGSAFVFIRTNGVWAQQGSTLLGSSDQNQALGDFPRYADPVALSADGNTALIGASETSYNEGGAFVFTRTNGVWSQQGPKLYGSGAFGPPLQGRSVALSANGNTALIGGSGDANAQGAVWVFTRSNGEWTQQGSKLVGSGIAGAAAQQGTSVALSADGNTALVGGPADNNDIGATWVFTRANGVWTQQGQKVVGSGSLQSPYQGSAVALSGDGSTAIVGGYGDNGGATQGTAGAAWVFGRTIVSKP